MKDALVHITYWKADVARFAKAPEAWFSGRERKAFWPFDLDGHSAEHRVRDIERAPATATARG